MNKLTFKLKKAFEWLFPRKKTTKHITIDEESVKKHHEIRGMANQIAELKGKIAKYDVEEGKKRERKRDKGEEEEVKIFLDKKKREIIKKTTPKYYSLKTFFNKLYKEKKFRNRLSFYSFDRSKKLGKFGDFGLSSDGDFVLLDDNRNLVIKMPRLNDIFQSVSALSNDINTFKIPLNMDGEGGYVENLMVYEAPEIIDTGKGMRFQKARKRPVYEIIQEYNERINESNNYTEELETLVNEQKKKIDDFERANKIERNSAETARTELSKAENRVTAIERSFRGMENELIHRRQKEEINEKNIEKLEKELDIMRGKAEREGVKLSDEKAREIIENIRTQIVRDLPEKQIEVIEKQTSEIKTKT